MGVSVVRKDKFLPPVGDSSMLSSQWELNDFVREFLPPVGDSSMLSKSLSALDNYLVFLPPVGDSSMLSSTVRRGSQGGSFYPLSGIHPC